MQKFAPPKSGKKPSVPQQPKVFVPNSEYKQSVLANARLGKNGYTIPKSVLSPEDIETMRIELFMRPITGMSYGGAGGGGEAAFPVYRENANKFYIPRFYGVHRYGLPPKCELEPGETIDVPFTKPLRDYQEHIISVYMKHVQTPIHSGMDAAGLPAKELGGGAILEVPCGRGKCLAKDTPILMHGGNVKLVQDVCVGDLLMGDDSTPRTVLSLARGRETMYKVVDVVNPHLSYVVNESHILSLLDTQTGQVVDMNVLDFVNGTHTTKRGFRVAVEFEQKHLQLGGIGPYDAGKLAFRYRNINASLEQREEGKGSLDDNTNWIPDIFKYNSKKIRNLYLNGVFETWGELANHNGQMWYVMEALPSKKWAHELQILAHSLGHQTMWDEPSMTLCVSVGRNQIVSYEIKVLKLEEDEYYGFEIDRNRRFVLGDMTVTHNTIMALKIVSELKRKTLILVHKEFLMNQWIERMADFIPSAKVGKIQGQIFDVVGKDVVIGMIQTLYDKEYPAGTFSVFGLTIIDEVHRIGSEQFSKTLLKIQTPYMLGISATVERKDGLTKILYHFIGDKIYSETRENDDAVCVRAIEYVCTDRKFNEVEYDFRGNPMYSKMISKLSEYTPRTEFVLRVLRDLLSEHEDGQIMVLAHQRGLLKYIHDAVVERKIGDGSVGFYVGGMKESALKETESKQIVLATYAMAAEALDIKSLSTLVMITPKTDIIQSVGRILRMKHDHPIVVDIVDKHDNFQKQWIQRRRFYKKCNYRIRMIGSDMYQGMELDWDNDKSWKWVFEPKKGAVCAEPGSESEEEGDANTKPKPMGCMINLGDIEWNIEE